MLHTIFFLLGEGGGGSKNGIFCSAGGYKMQFMTR